MSATGAATVPVRQPSPENDGGGPSGPLRRIGRHIRWQPVIVLVAITGAYHYSLLSLARGLTLPTPLAYLSLVPLIAIALAAFRLTRQPLVSPVHSEAMDHTLGRAYGLALLFAAVGIAVVLSSTISYAFWQYRIDLLTLPIFVAGVVSVVYGLRGLKALKFPIIFLFLAWPIPYLPLLGDGIRISVDLTLAALNALSRIVPIATPLAGGDGTYLIDYGSNSFVVAVAGACSGVNSFVGFLLVGTGFAYLVRGNLARKVAWLTVGLILVWLLNVIRIELIFVAGALAGYEVALDVLHPVAGLIVFNIGVLLMLALVPLFGLHLLGTTVASRLPEPSSTLLAWPSRRLRASLAMVFGVALVLGIANAGYSRFSPVAGDFGELRVRPLDFQTAAVPDWTSRFQVRKDQYQVYFGDDSTFDRYALISDSDAALTSSAAVYAEVVSTPDADALAAFGVEACYQFHDFTIHGISSVELGSGVTGQVLSYSRPVDGSEWVALWWEWPYNNAGTTWHQRVVLFLADIGEAEFGAPEPSGFESQSPAVFRPPENLLVGVARALVESQVEASLTAAR